MQGGYSRVSMSGHGMPKYYYIYVCITIKVPDFVFSFTLKKILLNSMSRKDQTFSNATHYSYTRENLFLINEGLDRSG